MSATLLILNEVGVAPGRAHEVLARWGELNEKEPLAGRTLFRSADGDNVLEITPVEDYAELDALSAGWRRLWDAVSADLVSDFRRQLLEFVEAPKDTADPLPLTQYVQLRYIEVKPKEYAAYREWRENTIFDVVRRAEPVTTFLAYHTLLSTQPGVMFVTGFDCEPEEYQKVFASAEYQDIVQQAGDRFIVGGESGLYTRVYRRADA
ncbi:hypothetical protein M4914_21015 [Streptomyces somaliensis DSM 40738]|uniref:Uncharacterized protein n=1 Tax=Streptomyces somaliensis (strain ATCC 33201 / DSM 40738 / JCM 12659 / KCTC 9044 / NCTC 11332 / NRRL B-12077 / IP 733) TaxID=1134445 RepID=A0AA44IC78_STRE0|nr:hypothetical protein [Streptomyces somaliensis]MCQ0025177.1 hypothetical protein [Streptomyces somaliensis DSM 40738]NKY13390.1 hypothetical protein [Streptomyces somaliensis DSM 40738]